jgi:hypothetical protein
VGEVRRGGGLAAGGHELRGGQAVLDEEETELLGCVYIDPPDQQSPPGTDAVVSWWMVDEARRDRARARARQVRVALADRNVGSESIHFSPVIRLRSLAAAPRNTSESYSTSVRESATDESIGIDFPGEI